MIERLLKVRIKDEDGEKYDRNIRLAYNPDDPFVVELDVQPAAGVDGCHHPWAVDRDMLWQAVSVGVGAAPIGDGDIKMAATPQRLLVFLYGSGDEDGRVATLYLDRPAVRRFLLAVREAVPPGEEHRFYSIDDVIARLLGQPRQVWQQIEEPGAGE